MCRLNPLCLGDTSIGFGSERDPCGAMAQLQALAVKLPEPKLFYGDHKLARAWMSAVKRYFIAVGLDEDEAAHSERMVHICCALM